MNIYHFFRRGALTSMGSLRKVDYKFEVGGLVNIPGEGVTFEIVEIKEANKEPYVGQMIAIVEPYEEETEE